MMREQRTALSAADEDAIARAAELRQTAAQARQLAEAADADVRNRFDEIAAGNGGRRRVIALRGDCWLLWYARRARDAFFLIFAHGGRAKIVGHVWLPDENHRADCAKLGVLDPNKPWRGLGHGARPTWFADNVIARATVEARTAQYLAGVLDIDGYIASLLRENSFRWRMPGEPRRPRPRRGAR